MSRPSQGRNLCYRTARVLSLSWVTSTTFSYPLKHRVLYRKPHLLPWNRLWVRLKKTLSGLDQITGLKELRTWTPKCPHRRLLYFLEPSHCSNGSNQTAKAIIPFLFNDYRTVAPTPMKFFDRIVMSHIKSTSLCNWLLRDHKQYVLETTPQATAHWAQGSLRAVCSAPSYSSYWYIAAQPPCTNHFVKFVDNTTLVGLVATTGIFCPCGAGTTIFC